MFGFRMGFSLCPIVHYLSPDKNLHESHRIHMPNDSQNLYDWRIISHYAWHNLTDDS